MAVRNVCEYSTEILATGPPTPFSQEELDEISIVCPSDNSTNDEIPTSPQSRALIKRKHCKTRIEDASSHFFCGPMSQEELDCYAVHDSEMGMGKQGHLSPAKRNIEGRLMFPRQEEDPSSSPLANELLRRKKMIALGNRSNDDIAESLYPHNGILQCFEEPLEENFNMEAPESPMSKALRSRFGSRSVNQIDTFSYGSSFPSGMAVEMSISDMGSYGPSKCIRENNTGSTLYDDRDIPASLDGFQNGDEFIAPSPLASSLLRRKKAQQLNVKLAQETNFFKLVSPLNGGRKMGSPSGAFIAQRTPAPYPPSKIQKLSPSATPCFSGSDI